MTLLSKIRFNPLVFKWSQKSSKQFTLHLLRNFTIVILLLFALTYLVSNTESKSVSEEFHTFHNTLTYPLDEEAVIQLEAYLNNPQLSDYEKGLCAETLYNYYFFAPDYIKAVEYVGHALFYYERCQDYYSIAHSRFTMVLAMNSFHAFKNSEKVVYEILEIDISNKTEADSIKYYAYVNLADICSQTDRVTDALLYLQEAEALAAVLPDLEKEYSYMTEIVKARCHFLQGDFKGCEETLALLPSNLLANSTPFLNLYVSYLDVQSKVLLQNGKTKNALNVSQTLVDYCSTHNYGNIQLEHIYDIIELCELKDITNSQIDTYKQIIKETSPALIQQRTEDMAIFMKYAYDSLTSSMANLIYADQLKWNSSALILIFMIIAAIFFILLKRSIDKGRLDGLTGTYNRHHFNYIYDGALINHIPFSIIILDVDNFKSCNDTYGHEFGDEVLIRVCKCVDRCLPPGFQLFRYGGEEFCVFCPYTTAEQAYKLAETIRQKTAKLTWTQETTITISLGVADSKTSEKPFTVADERLYTAKHTGKNKVIWR